MRISILILTLNEAQNIELCLDSLSAFDDIVVLDSYSSDDTVAIAESRGAKIFYRRFDDYASQRNFGLACDFKHDWVLMLDADERVPEEFLEELKRVSMQADNPVTLYRMRRKDMFMGCWLKRSSGYPTWFGRLFRKGSVRVEREINEEYYTDGEVGLLDGHLIHYPFNKGITFWMERHNRYSSMEAFRIIEERNMTMAWDDFLSSDPMLRRKAFKAFAYRMPCRPFLAFCFLYFIKLGFLDGKAGFFFCLLRSIYEFLIDLKINEIKRRKKGLPV
ncbi:glycosyltransferase family 2 protein [Coraliomargarita sp. W4R53]